MTRDEVLKELYNNMTRMVKQGVIVEPYENWRSNMNKFSDNDLLKMLGATRKLLK